MISNNRETNGAQDAVPQNIPPQPLARYKYALLVAAVCLFALGLAAIYRLNDHTLRSADALDGKWSANVLWNEASGRPYARTMHTALFFLPDGRFGTVITFPTGAIGGAGRYRLRGSRLTIRCTSLSINGHDVPLSTFAHAPWFHDTAVYTAAMDGADLTLTPAAPPTPAPGYPLLTSPKPLIFSRVEAPAPESAEPAPRE